MAGRDATVALGEALAVLEAARDAGRDVGDSIGILPELITENPRSEWWQCGHVEESAPPSQARQGLRAVKCDKYRPG